MAFCTNKELKSKTIYSIYVRNHSSQGDFSGVLTDLDRIKDLGVDIIWLLPIHPIGVKNKKGTLGCPYSISDYRDVNPEYGTLDDFKKLINGVHERGMKLMIDVVYNHTSHDSILVKEHPEYFYKKIDGKMGNKCGDWTDIVDLDYANKELWEYQLKTLRYWAELGIDGVRCDVASLVPLEFWEEAREQINAINPKFIWLAETVHTSFLKEFRLNGFVAHSDSEMYNQFDITYDYDTHGFFTDYFENKGKLSELIYHKSLQELIYPQNYIKLRFLENHDQLRSAFFIKDRDTLFNWNAFMFFENGTPLIYAGQETLNKNTPSLFEKEVIDLEVKDKSYYEFLRKLIAMKKKSKIFTEGIYDIINHGEDGFVEALYKESDGENDVERYVLGIFNLDGSKNKKQLSFFKYLKDLGHSFLDEKFNGRYENMIDGKLVEIYNGTVAFAELPAVLEFEVKANEK